MSMVLEYPMKLFILIVVVFVVVGIMISYKSKIMGICLTPPCDEEKNLCDVETIVSTEEVLDSNSLQKYCSMCYMKNDYGECRDDVVCYVVNLDNVIDPSSIPLESEYCFVKCEKNATSVYVQYIGLTGAVEIAC